MQFQRWPCADGPAAQASTGPLVAEQEYLNLGIRADGATRAHVPGISFGVPHGGPREPWQNFSGDFSGPNWGPELGVGTDVQIPVKNVTREPSPVSSYASQGLHFETKSSNLVQGQGSNIIYVNPGIVDDKGINISDEKVTDIASEEPTHAELMALWRSSRANAPLAGDSKHDKHVASNVVSVVGAGGLDAGLPARAPAAGACVIGGCVDAGLPARAPVAATTANTTTASHSPTLPFCEMTRGRRQVSARRVMRVDLTPTARTTSSKRGPGQEEAPSRSESAKRPATLG